jgi:hypothetical protein
MAEPNLATDLGSISVVAKGIAPNSTPEDRIISADAIRAKAAEDNKSSAVNTETQWVPAIMSFLGGNAREALKYYNGGPTRVEEAYHPSLGKFLKEYNDRGVTGRVYVQEGDKQIPVDNKTISEIDRAGGLISKTDLTAMQSAPWSAANDIVKAQKTGLAKPVLEQYERSTKAAIAGTAMRNALEQRRAIIADKQMAPVFEAIGKLSPQDRQRLFGMVMLQSSKTSGSTAEEQKGTNANVNIQRNLQGNVGAKAGVGFDEVGGVAPPGGSGSLRQGGIGISPNVGVSGGISGGQSNAVGASGRYGTNVGQTSGTAESIQANVQSEINKILQGAITGPDQFAKLQKAIQLGTVIDEQIAGQKPEEMAPGASKIAPLNPALASRQDVVENDIGMMKNNALSVAWNSYLAKAIHEDQRNSEPSRLDELRNNFMNTKTFKAIQRTYDRELERSKGKDVPLESGGVYIDRNNKLRRWNGDDWEQ